MERVCPKCAEKDKEIADLNKKIVELQFFIDDLKESQEIYKKKISEICRQLEKEKDRYNQLLEEKSSNETYKKKINELSKQLEEEKDKYNQLKKEKDSYEASNKTFTEHLRSEHESRLNRYYFYLNNHESNIRYFPIPHYEGVSIVDALHSIGFETSLNYRKRIADVNKIGNGKYLGMNENLKMLELLRNGRLIIP